MTLLVFKKIAVFMQPLNLNVSFSILVSFVRQFHIRGTQYEKDLLPDADFKNKVFNKRSPKFVNQKQQFKNNSLLNS